MSTAHNGLCAMHRGELVKVEPDTTATTRGCQACALGTYAVIVLCDNCAQPLAGLDVLTIGGHSRPCCDGCGHRFAQFLEQANHYRRAQLRELAIQLVRWVSGELPPPSSQGGA